MTWTQQLYRCPVVTEVHAAVTSVINPADRQDDKKPLKQARVCDSYQNTLQSPHSLHSVSTAAHRPYIIFHF